LCPEAGRVAAGGGVNKAEFARKRAGFLEACEHETRWKDASARAGISYDAVRQWFSRDPAFRVLAERRLGLRVKSKSPDDFPDFPDFRKRFFGHETFWYHLEAYRHLEEADELVMLVPPEHAKTQTWAIEHSAYRIFRDPNVRIIVVCANENEAKKVIHSVKELLSNHDVYRTKGIADEDNPITVFGGARGFKERPWGDMFFRVAGTSLGAKEYTMEAKGFGSKIYGARADLIIVDDLQDPMDNTPGHVEKILRLYQHVLHSRLLEGGKLLSVGTRIGPGDMWDHLMNDSAFEDFRVVNYPAVLDWDKKQQLNPDLFTWERLMKKRKVSGDVWATAWMQEDVDIEAVTFKRHLMERSCNPTRYLGDVPPEADYTYLGVDPAIEKHMAIITWALDPRSGKRYLVDIFNRKGLRTHQNVSRAIIDHIERYRPRACVIENRNIQAGYINDPDVRRAAASVGTRLVPYVTSTETGARAEERDFDISKVGGLYDVELVDLPHADATARTAVDAYIDQCCAWRPGIKHLTRDMVMGTLFAESEAVRDVRASQKPTKRKKKVPRWASNRDGGWRWRTPDKPGPELERDEDGNVKIRLTG